MESMSKPRYVVQPQLARMLAGVSLTVAMVVGGLTLVGPAVSSDSLPRNTGQGRAEARDSRAGAIRDGSLVALVSAARRGDLEGVLRVTEAFETTGEVQLAAEGVRMAQRLAAGDPERQADLREWLARR